MWFKNIYLVEDFMGFIIFTKKHRERAMLDMHKV